MSDESEEPQGAAEDTKPPKIKAEDNPWCLLATLFGVPRKTSDEQLLEMNRIAWNRYFAADVDEETRARLIEEGRHPAEELAPYSPEERQEVAKAFAERCKASAQELTLLVNDIINDIIIDFSNVEFEHDASFKRYLFTRGAFFRRAAFLRSADFGGATFVGGSNFGGATFSGKANFDGATFSGAASFNGAKFSGDAIFSRSTFGGASFNGTTFSGAGYFVCATFAYWGYFRGATFSRWAHFGGATFSGEADFNQVIFSGRANFGKAIGIKKNKVTYFGGTASFVNAEMKGETSFEDAVFKTEPPRFFGAKLHEGTVWRDVSWPRPKYDYDAGKFVDAYERLKLEMDRLKKHEDELDFFALELQSRRVLVGPVLGLPIIL